MGNKREIEIKRLLFERNEIIKQAKKEVKTLRKELLMIQSKGKTR